MPLVPAEPGAQGLNWVNAPVHGRQRSTGTCCLGVVAVTLLMFVPSEWYEHYAAFDGPFVVLAVALPVARLLAVTRELGRLRRPSPG